MTVGSGRCDPTGFNRLCAIVLQQELLHVCCRHHRPNQIALHYLALQVLQIVELVIFFDSFRHHFQVEAARHVGEQIVLVAHGGVMDILYRLATQQALQAPRTWTLGNANINRLLWSPEGLSLVGWGDARHLETDSLDESTA